MTDLFIVLVAILPLLLVMALGSPSYAADPREKQVRKSLRNALDGLVSSGWREERIARIAADELDELSLLLKGAR